jgi:16S rRNA (adenine1518-N6/adenine1519-N6)-dimethyltransferase
VGRRLGQHYLFDPSILDRIVGALEPRPDDSVLEVGPGRGTLTARLLLRVGRVLAIEKDPALAERLRITAAGTGLTVVEADALRADWHALLRGAYGTPASRYKVVGNIPYYITSPLIEKALTAPVPDVVVFLVQREVADRMVAVPGSKAFGALTVGVGVVAEVERLFTVPAGAFRPPPKVESAVVRLTPRADPLVGPADHPAFRRFVQALFGRRRKQIAGILRAVTGLTREEAEVRLHQLGIPATARPEQVGLAEFVALFRDFGGGVESADAPRVDSVR